MKTLLVLAALAAATPAMANNANFVGPRVAVTAGVDDVRNARDTSNVSYGAELGIDAPLGTNGVVGVQVTADNAFDRDRTFGVTGRLGYALTPNAMPYVHAGYVNYRNINFRNRATTLDGLRAGAGVEFAINPHVFTKVEYRYSDFENNVGAHGGLIGFGLRF